VKASATSPERISQSTVAPEMQEAQDATVRLTKSAALHLNPANRRKEFQTLALDRQKCMDRD